MTREEQRQLQREKVREQRRREREAWGGVPGPMDLPFLLLVLMLTVIGLIMLLSASFPSAQLAGDALYYFKRQAIFAVLGVLAMFSASKINYQRFRGLAKIGLIVSLALLVLVVIPGVGITRNHATRWLGIPGTDFQFQPSEVAKLGIILYFAATIAKKRSGC